MSKYEDKLSAKREEQLEKEKKYLSVITRFYVIFVLSIYPLYVGTEGYNDIIHQKAQVYWAGSIIFIIAFLLFYIAYILGSGKKDFGKKWWTKLHGSDWALIAFSFFVTLSCIVSEYQNIVWLGYTNRNDGWLTMFCMIAAFFIVSRWYKPNQTDFTLFAISSCVFSIYGFLQFYGYDFLHLFPYTQSNMIDANGNPLYSGFSISYRSTIGNIDFVSAYVCMSVIAFAILYAKTQGKVRFLYGATSAMSFIFMMIVGADAGKMGVLGAMVLLIPFWIIDKKVLGRIFTLVSVWGFLYVAHHWIMINRIIPTWGEVIPVYDNELRKHYAVVPLNIIILLSIVFLLVGVAFLSPLIKSWFINAKKIGAIALVSIFIIGFAGVELVGKKLPESNIVYQAREIMHGNLDDSFGSNRGFIWKKSLGRVNVNPMLGTGSDTFIHAFGKANQNEAQEKHLVNYDKAHNDFIQILLCNGIPALLAYLTFLVSIITMSVKKAFENTFLLVAMGTSVAYIIQSFFGVDTLTVTPIYWLTLAVMRKTQELATSK